MDTPTNQSPKSMKVCKLRRSVERISQSVGSQKLLWDPAVDSCRAPLFQAADMDWEGQRSEVGRPQRTPPDPLISIHADLHSAGVCLCSCSFPHTKICISVKAGLFWGLFNLKSFKSFQRCDIIPIIRTVTLKNTHMKQHVMQFRGSRGSLFCNVTIKIEAASNAFMFPAGLSCLLVVKAPPLRWPLKFSGDLPVAAACHHLCLLLMRTHERAHAVMTAGLVS